MNIKIVPKEIHETVLTLENKGFEAFLVGGCVRDLILDKEPKDWDLTTNAIPEEIMVIFPDHVYENTFGTVGVKTESNDEKLKIVEITPYREESGYSDNRHPDKINYSQNIEDDLQRRDFTMNAIAYNVGKGLIIDPYGGQKDIKDKVIRTVGSPNDRFSEDALRMLRAIRFSAELGFMINIETMQAIADKAELLKNVSRERIRDEFIKIVMSKNPVIGLSLAKQLNITPYISTIFKDMFDVKQNKDAHLYDVWEHSLRTLQHAADSDFSLHVRLAALFHDSAKPSTKRELSSKTTFYGHEVVGAKVTRETLENLKFSKEIIEKTVRLVRWHMFFSDTEEITLAAVRRLISKVGKENIWDLINLRKCDRIGTGRPKEQPYRLRKFQAMIDEVLRDPISVGMLSIDGNVLINELHMKPGPKIGFILHALLEDVLDNPKLNSLEYLKKRSVELSELDIKELKELGDKAKEAKEQAEERELDQIKQKRFVR